MDLKAYLESSLQQARGHLVQTEQAIAQHVATDFEAVLADMKAVYAHIKADIERLEAMLK